MGRHAGMPPTVLPGFRKKQEGACIHIKNRTFETGATWEKQNSNGVIRCYSLLCEIFSICPDHSTRKAVPLWVMSYTSYIPPANRFFELSSSGAFNIFL
jgi:hypothetical protein